MNPIAEILRAHPLMVLDGALATELEGRGCDLHDPLWSARVLIEAPELIRQVHADYFAAGADVAISASYQATFAGFARRGLSEQQATELMRLSVRLAAEARDTFWADLANRAGRPRPLVAASVGPYGAFLADGSEYTGDYELSEQQLIDFHRPRIAVLASAGADLLACETIPSLAEARALVRLLAEFPDQRAWVSFSARDAAHTCHGEPIGECAAWLDRAEQVLAIGINCTAPRHIAGLVRTIRAATRKPIVVYPNSGESYHADAGGWDGQGEADDLAAQARLWHASGAQLIGGCCRTTPTQIQSIARWARAASAPA